ncbi:MAG: hypothetical protein CL676_13505 [Bdellovibrionaceae bacterium]|nr:hypothetical protein [Pseudobdellovibrionaceae bacterium]|tara:strand:+ start:3186 stop:3920 length:735 start_codon:yes stop_codon:yes gene_type:complete
MNAVANPGETLPKNMPRGREVLVDKICHLIQATENLMGPSRDLTKITNRFNEKFKNTDLKKLARLVEVAEKNLFIHLSQTTEISPEPTLDDSPAIFRIALDHYKVRVSDEFFKDLEFNDLIELYDMEHFQIFRTFNFYQLSNYTLEDILMNEWYNLYERPAHITDKIMQQVEEHFKSGRNYSKFDVESHIMKEIFAKPRGAFVTRFKSLATTYSDSGEPTGFACAISAKALEADNVELLNLSQL